VPDLAATTLALVNIPSESRNEAEAVAWVEASVPLPLAYAGDDTRYYATPRRAGRPLVVLAGHLDTVPAQENLPGRIEEGWVVGLGTTDMKGGCAVLVELARAIGAGLQPAVDIGLLFFPREELPSTESALPGFFAANPDVLDAELAVMLEPTDATLHVGCLGNLNAELVYHGESAHSARPWTGVNAVERAVEGLARILPVPPRRVDLGGLEFVEVTTATRLDGGIAANVVPARAVCLLNHRYAADRSPADAEARIRELADEAGADEVRIIGNSSPAPVVVDAPLVQRLRAAGSLDVLPKQAWTPVAEFAEVGIDAVNYGPGATRYAHTQDERVEIAALERVYETLSTFLTDTV
jgi:succinyl-diaminopimelate desuccinylase